MEEKRQLRICVFSSSNDFAGRVLAKLQTPDVNENFTISWSFAHFELQKSVLAPKLVKIDPDQFIFESLLNNDVFLFDLNSTESANVHTLVNLLKNHAEVQTLRKKIILVSDVLTWQCYLPKFEEEAETAAEVSPEGKLTRCHRRGSRGGCRRRERRDKRSR